MQAQEMLNTIESILDDAKTAILVTTDASGKPYGRWMTPVMLKQRPGVIFAFAAVGSNKLGQIEEKGDVLWLVQTKDLRQVVHVRGVIRIVDNPALKSELMEILGPRLAVFWKANVGKDEFVVVETVMQEATYTKPMKGLRETVVFEWKGT
jgi:general stress protein 26